MPRPIDLSTFLAATLDPESRTPLSRQLYDEMKTALSDGRLPAGTRLPSTRALAEALGPSVAASQAPEELLGARRGSAANRRWAARHTDASRAATLRWWLLGLPFRLAVYRPGRWTRRWRRTRTRDRRLAAAGN